MRKLLIAAGLALAALAASPAGAATPQRLPNAAALDKLPAEFTRHTRAHRNWEIQRNLERQQRWNHGRYNRGYNRGYGYQPGYRHQPGYGGMSPYDARRMRGGRD